MRSPQDLRSLPDRRTNWARRETRILRDRRTRGDPEDLRGNSRQTSHRFRPQDSPPPAYLRRDPPFARTADARPGRPRVGRTAGRRLLRGRPPGTGPVGGRRRLVRPGEPRRLRRTQCPPNEPLQNELGSRSRKPSSAVWRASWGRLSAPGRRLDPRRLVLTCRPSGRTQTPTRPTAKATRAATATARSAAVPTVRAACARPTGETWTATQTGPRPGRPGSAGTAVGPGRAPPVQSSGPQNPEPAARTAG